MQDTSKIILYDGREINHGDCVDLPMDRVEPNMFNPNEMDDLSFALLENNVETIGFVDPIVVVPMKDGKFQICDGEHRWEQRRISGEKEIPCIVVSPEIFDEKMLMLQTVRLNKIRGSLNSEKFNALIDQLVNKHDIPFEDLAEELGFADEDEFEALVKQGRAQLPKEARKEYDKAVKNVQGSVSQLAKIIEKLWLKYSCFAPQTLVSTEYGMKRICEIKPGDKVFTHLGRLKKVTNVFSRDYTGQMLKIKVQKISDPIMCTPGHEFFQVKGSYKNILPKHFGKSKFNFSNAKIIKTKAEDLWFDDWLVIVNNTGDTSYPEDAPCPLTEEFAWFLGLYIAEGFPNRLEKQEDYVCLCLGIDEELLANRALSFAREYLVGEKATDKNPTCVVNTSTRVIRIRNQSLADWLDREVGKGAENKHVPTWMSSQPNNIINAFINGAVDGDGHLSSKGTCEYSTISMILAYQIRDLIAKLELAGSFVDKNTKGFGEGRKHTLRVVSWSMRTKYIQSGFMDSEMKGFTVKINKCEPFHYEGKIFNLEVEEDHTYQVYGLAVGNSTVPANFFILDYGSMRHLWVTMDKEYLALTTDKFRDIFASGYKVSSVLQQMLAELDVTSFIEDHLTSLEKIDNGEQDLDSLLDLPSPASELEEELEE